MVQQAPAAPQQLIKQKGQHAVPLKDFKLREDGPTMLVTRIKSLKNLKRVAGSTSDSRDMPEANETEAQRLHSLINEASILQQPAPVSEAEERIKHSREASTSGRSVCSCDVWKWK